MSFQTNQNRAGLIGEGILLPVDGFLDHQDSIVFESDAVLTVNGFVGPHLSIDLVGECIGTYTTPPTGNVFNPAIIVHFDDSYGKAYLIGEGVPVDGPNFELNWHSAAGFHYGPQAVVGGGGGGGSGAEFTHAQSTPQTVWIVNHNLGFRPDVAITSIGGLTVDAEVQHVSNNQLTITFDVPFSGYARCT